MENNSLTYFTSKKVKTNTNFFDKISKTKDGDIELERLVEMFEEIVFVHKK